jgi:hypothetical protein
MIRMQVLDAHTEPSGAINEDAFGHAEGAAWVLDGTTGVGERPLLPGRSDPRWLVDRVCEALPTALAGGASTAEALRRVIRSTSARFAAEAIVPEAPPSERPSACLAMLRLLGGEVELSNLGDCILLQRDRGAAVRTFGSSGIAPLDEALNEAIRELQQREAISHSVIWERLVVPLVRRNRAAAMNRPGGYWVLALDEAVADHLQSARVPAVTGERFLVASDGFYRLVDLYGRYTKETLFEAALARGIAPLVAEVRALDHGDPEGRAYPRAKIADDATAVLVEIG